MAEFNYTKLHFFDKSGTELPVFYKPSYSIICKNSYNDNAIFYPVLDENHKIIDYYKVSSGNRFKNNTTVPCILNIGQNSYESNCTVELEQTNSNRGNDYCVKTISSINLPDNYDELLQEVPFPSLTLSSSVPFKEISIGLVETQSIYVLVEKDNNFIKLSEYTTDSSINYWKDSYKLLFFIDNRNQEDFRFFTVSGDELIWTNKIIMDFNSTEENSFKINIGFSADEEGVYEQQMYVCLLKTNGSEDDSDWEIFPIGEMTLAAEAIGEDERYRTLFADFGIPDPINYQNIFTNTSNDESKLDYIKLNENSKKMFLSYTDIFPYVGSYKALINAVKVLGYENLFFKEWYKETGKVLSTKGYISYDISYNSDSNSNVIENLSIEERISLRKLNWLSMVYRINKVISESEDEYGFPTTEELYSVRDTEIIAKLYYLKKWLERYITGLQCRIIDISGEGIYFERYRLNTFGTYQQIFDWNNEKNLIPKVISTPEDVVENGKFIADDVGVLKDSSAFIKVDVGLNINQTIEEYKTATFQDFIDGYLQKTDSSCIYYEGLPEDYSDSSIESIIFTGKTFECLNDFETYKVKAVSNINGYLFNNEFIDDDSASLMIKDNDIFFNPEDLLKHEKQTTFKKLPLIQLEKANIRKISTPWKNSVKYKISSDLRDDTSESYFINNLETGDVISTIDYITLIPPVKYEDYSSYTIITPASDRDNPITLTSYDSYDEFDYKSIDKIEEKIIAKEGKSYKFNHKTFGLRYSALNDLHIPMFSIIGYELDNYSDYFDSRSEYVLEILDGKMIFDDSVRNRQIILNFNYDTESNKQTVQINVVYDTEEFFLQRYYNLENNVEKYITNFIPGNDYSPFYEKYIDEYFIKDAILYKNIYSLKVYNSGIFDITVYGKDIHNNIYAKNCENLVKVTLPDFSINTYTNLEYSGDNYNKANRYGSRLTTDEISKLISKYVPFCVYNNSYFVRDFDKDIDDKTNNISLTYPNYSYSHNLAAKDDYLHFLNISDRFKIKHLNYSYSSTSEEKYKGFGLILNRYDSTYHYKVLDEYNNDAISAMYPNGFVEDNKSIYDILYQIGQSELSYADVNFVLYNELGHYPILQTYGKMINENAIPYMSDDDLSLNQNGNFHLLLGDFTEESYIWAKLDERVQNDIWRFVLKCNNDYDPNSTSLTLKKNIIKYFINILNVENLQISSSQLETPDINESFTDSSLSLYENYIGSSIYDNLIEIIDASTYEDCNKIYFEDSSVEFNIFMNAVMYHIILNEEYINSDLRDSSLGSIYDKNLFYDLNDLDAVNASIAAILNTVIYTADRQREMGELYKEYLVFDNSTIEIIENSVINALYIDSSYNLYESGILSLYKEFLNSSSVYSAVNQTSLQYTDGTSLLSGQPRMFTYTIYHPLDDTLGGESYKNKSPLNKVFDCIYNGENIDDVIKKTAKSAGENVKNFNNDDFLPMYAILMFLLAAKIVLSKIEYIENKINEFYSTHNINLEKEHHSYLDLYYSKYIISILDNDTTEYNINQAAFKDLQETARDVAKYIYGCNNLDLDEYEKVPLTSEITSVQPMTGIVVWSTNDSHRTESWISMEFAYVLYNDVCKEKDVYDWSSVDSLLNEIASRNHQAILRFRYVEPGKTCAVPNYIKELPEYEVFYGTSEGLYTEFPDWRCEELQRFHIEFYRDFAEHFDNDPRIAFIQTGFGLWAEYHLSNSEGCFIPGRTFPSKEFQARFLTSIDSFFKKLPWSISIDAANEERGPFSKNEEYNNNNQLDNLKFGLFDDSFMCEEHDVFNKENWEAFAEDNALTSPHGGEFSYYTDYDQNHCLDKNGIYGRTFEDEAARYNISYIIGNDQPGKQSIERLTEASLATGYRFRIKDYRVKEGVGAIVVIKNEGVAPIYKDTFIALDGIRATYNLRNLVPGEEVTIEVTNKKLTTASEIKIVSDYILPTQSISFVADDKITETKANDYYISGTKALLHALPSAEDSEIPVYDKLIKNNSEEIKKHHSYNWVFKKYTYPQSDDRPYDYEYLFAVAAEVSSTNNEEETENTSKETSEYSDNSIKVAAGNKYYVKPYNMLNEGLIWTSNYDEQLNPKNDLPDIKKLLDLPYVTAYIQPTWKAQVSIGILSPESFKYLNIPGNVDKMTDAEIEEACKEYLTVEYVDPAFNWHFAKGEMVKLIFESLTNSNYVGQSSYEVVGYDIIGSVLIIKGKLNEAYIKTEENEVWALIDTNMFSLSKEEYDYIHSKTFENMTDIDEKRCKALIRTYKVKDDNGNIINTIQYKLPIHKKDGNWYYKVLFYQNGILKPIRLSRLDTSERVKMYISYAHNAFVDYTVTAKDGKEQDNGFTNVDINYDRDTRIKMQFIDDTFVFSSNNFDINEGLYAWMNYDYDYDNDIYNPVINSTDEEDNSYVFKYHSSSYVPVCITSKSPNICFEVNFDDLGLNENNSYVCWRIYRKLNTDNTRKLLFESYNKVLFLDSEIPGIYDIEATIYDMFGNSNTKLFKGAYKLVKSE